MKAFIDKAQSSIMGFDCAKQCNLVKDINEVFQGTAVGVGDAENRRKSAPSAY